MSNHPILVETAENIGTITLNRPEQMNTFSSPLARELNQALLALDHDPDVRAIVVAGTGSAFCAGIDLSEYAGKTHGEYRRWVTRMEEMVLTIANMKTPVIASARGFAVANGAGIVLAADLAVIADNTRFAVPAVNIGLFCMGPAVPLTRTVPRKRAMELLLLGDLISAAQALAWGLVNQVVPDEELEAATAAMAAKLAAKSPVAVQMGKQAIHRMADMPLPEALVYSNEMFASLCVTEDAREGVDAFLNKREATWKGC
ncbi:MAG: enoyl-CoA hydratase-related protein [Desulfobacterales bacterium]|nr:enoyl-CoA hydratase-related protein [Desulfobacterales bacterium]MDJ0854992.1 enoyl-CoA hydratase-related protein [Desulfobacterales bacterium]MDJ0887810.1 enoyl-CoA hydratase-related protein [Desulfobacterales bacterium]MDJ0991607.1 enoyl-CoA hydratase-related protein [Desulfobacterales bacterium]